MLAKDRKEELLIRKAANEKNDLSVFELNIPSDTIYDRVESNSLEKDLV